MASELAARLRALVDGERLDPEATRRMLDPEAAEALIDLSDRFSALRQRSAELRAVMSSTRDLLAIPDADLLLQRIVDRAHELMDVDITYLSVYEPERDELYVRAASGAISPRFLAMVVPAGVGLASLAVRTRSPQWVDDYTALSTVPHDPTIDAIVAEEELRSLLGAPLVVGDEVLGVLFAASRASHVFRADEVALLTAFAGHAALVLRLAQLLQQAQDATAEAASRQQQAEWAASLHGELTRLVVFGHGADAVVGALAEALGRAVLLVDDEGGPISLRHPGEDDGGRPAEDDSGRVSGLAPAELRRLIADLGDDGRSALIEGTPYELIAPVATASTRPGALLVERGERLLTAVERRTVERSALTAALLVLRRDALADAEDRVRGELAIEVLDSSPDRRASGLLRATAHGYPVRKGWSVLAIPAEGDERNRIRSRLRSRDGWLVATLPAGVVVMIPAARNGADHAVHEAVHAVEVPFAVVATASSLGDAAAAADEAWRTCRLASGLGAASGVVDATAFAPYALLFDGDGARMSAYVAEMLGPLLAWDEQHGTGLLDTLAALFDEHWSLAAAARRLHVHLNTLKQRVQRMRVLLGAGLDRPEERFRLELAVRIEGARRALREPT
ncbi:MULTISPECIES: helix-turn-helix domain-containing protein [unclassified Microbacterium]|uniref:helix-turn-helix domain-containing protein n=1 Tax=unclassified Microbacterium TaxID=2609290 RepID=UPI0012FB8112|nr:helix-turn-helix domain-containing protein [Microbacterium sp. MAH-37]MVQ41507.1 GAF domain-containing protein [Microbacterium sp. MAH-37]